MPRVRSYNITDGDRTRCRPPLGRAVISVDIRDLNPVFKYVQEPSLIISVLQSPRQSPPKWRTSVEMNPLT